MKFINVLGGWPNDTQCRQLNDLLRRLMVTEEAFGITSHSNVALVVGNDMLHVCMVLAGVCILLQGTSVIGECPRTSISMCTIEEESGSFMYVDFERVPRLDVNLSCFCYVFSDQTGHISIRFALVGNSTWPDVQVDNVPVEKVSSAWSPITPDSYKIIHYKGGTDKSFPSLCFRIDPDNTTTILSVKCRSNGDTTIPTNIAKSRGKGGPRESNDIPTTTATMRGEDGHNEATAVPTTQGIIAGAVAGGLVVVVAVAIASFMLGKRRGSTQQQTQQETRAQHEANAQDVTLPGVRNTVHLYDDADVVMHDTPEGDVLYLTPIGDVTSTGDATNATAGHDVQYDDATTTGLYVGLIPTAKLNDYSVLFQKP